MTRNDPDFVTFLKSYPTYPTTHLIDDLRATEYARLDTGGHIYLDYTGGGLYAESQLRRHNRLLAEHVFGNPHSSNPTSQAATQLVEHAREYVLKFFNADPEEYLAIFTPNASGALKLVGESYPFPGGRYLLIFDNHNSVNGIREFAHLRGAEVTYIRVAITCSLTRRNPTFRRSSILLSGLTRPMLMAGMSSWMRPRSFQPTGS